MGEKLSISLRCRARRITGCCQERGGSGMAAGWEHGDGPWAWGLEGSKPPTALPGWGWPCHVPHAMFQHATWCSSLLPSMSGGQLLGVLVWAGHLSTAAVMGKVEGMGKELKAGTVSGCISLASPFSLKNGPSTVHLKPYLFIMRGAVCFFISLL